MSILDPYHAMSMKGSGVGNIMPTEERGISNEKTFRTLLAVSFLIILSADFSVAQSEDEFTSPDIHNENELTLSVYSNRFWALNKSIRKMLSIKYLTPDTVWKSSQTTIQANFDLDCCIFKTVGRGGGSTFLYDESSGMITFYQANMDHSVSQFRVVNLKDELR